MESLQCRGVRDDIEEEDVEEAYYRYMEENPMAGVIQDDDDEFLEYDADGNPILPDRKVRSAPREVHFRKVPSREFCILYDTLGSIFHTFEVIFSKRKRGFKNVN